MKSMKIMVLTGLTFLALTSCDKLQKDKHCAVLQERDVPTAVVDAFYGAEIIAADSSVSYTNHNPQGLPTWFNKDNTGYCVAFLDANGVETMMLYDLQGNYVKTVVETDDDKEGFFNKDKDKGCECDVEDGDDDNDEDDDHE